MKRLLPLFFILCLVAAIAAADPLPLLDDYSDEIVQLIDESDPSAGKLVYAYRYPHVDEEAEGGAEINAFYEDQISLSEFESSFNPGTTTITYDVTCNNDEYFSVLVHIVKTSEEQSSEQWVGQVFSRKNASPGLTCTLPRLLGTLEQNENDTWLQDRQTEKADALLVDMVWERIEDNEEDIDYFPDFTKEQLSHIFFPEEDFYLDDTGNPVFYIQPGKAAPEGAGLLTYFISLEDILDEL
jgi:hypothetical protein